MTTTTTNHLPRSTRSGSVLLWLRWYHTRLLYAWLGAAWVIVALLGAQALHGPLQGAPLAAPTPALPVTTLPIVVIQKAPTLAPVPTTTPDHQVLDELAALREQVAQLQAAQAAPQVVYQVINAPEQAAPTVDAEQYTVANAPPPTPMAPQTAAILDRNAWAAQAAEQRKP